MDADITIDAIGLLCPLPVLRLRKRMVALQIGQVACLLANDPAATIDVPHFCNEQGHVFLGGTADGDATAYLIRKT